MSNPILDHINLNGTTYDIACSGALNATLSQDGSTLTIYFDNQLPAANGNSF